MNLTSHLEKVTEDIVSYIPDVNYDGIAVIDWEYWSPVWEAELFTYTKFYTSASIQMVQDRHPDWDRTLVEQVARIEFEQAAQSLFASTLRLATELRPKALWGFYHFPYCYYSTAVGNCSQLGMQVADRMKWLYAETPALYPSIYLKDSMDKGKRPAEYVQSVLRQALEFRRNPWQPVLAYFRYKYTRSDLYLNLVCINLVPVESCQCLLRTALKASVLCLRLARNCTQWDSSPYSHLSLYVST